MKYKLIIAKSAKRTYPSVKVEVVTGTIGGYFTVTLTKHLIRLFYQKHVTVMAVKPIKP